MVVLRTVDTRPRLVTAGRVLLRRRGVAYPPAVRLLPAADLAGLLAVTPGDDDAAAVDSGSMDG